MRPALAGLLLLAALPAHARVTRLDILEQTPFAGGASFGDAGPYVRIRAIAHGELDPAAPANAVIALLQQAPRNARGMVEYDTDVDILRPADPARGAHVMLYDVTNRGNKFVPLLDQRRRRVPRRLRQRPSHGRRRRQRVYVPPRLDRGLVRLAAGGPAGEPRHAHPRAHRHQSRPADRSAHPQRDRHRHPRAGARHPASPFHTPPPTCRPPALRSAPTKPTPSAPIAPDHWRWIDHQTIQLEPWDTPFTPRSVYDLTYEATAPTVNGIGFAATRDVVAYLRRQDGVQHTIGFGVSLSGRFLRHFLDLGMNRDEDGGRVFDGMLPHIGGAGKVFANEAFAMPGRTATQHEDRFYPEVWQPVGYGPNGLLRDPATDPKIIESNTSTEYWQKAASLVHTDPAGHDAALPDTVRMMMVAGTQHGGHFGTSATPGPCANPRNPNSSGPALRAALHNLEAWVVHNIAPPATIVPRQSDETGIPATAIHMPAIPGVTWPRRDNPVGQPVDWTSPPPAPVNPMPSFVAAADADGNELAGLRMPNIAVPLGTYTGVNVYRDRPGELCDRDGITLPFARTRADRDRTHDPRLSLEERYSSREDYVAKLTAAADALVAARRLLPEDRDRYVAAAREAPGFQ